MDNYPVIYRINVALVRALEKGMPFRGLTLCLGTESAKRLREELSALKEVNGGVPDIYTNDRFAGLSLGVHSDLPPNEVKLVSVVSG